MPSLWRRGCMGLLLALFSVILIVGALAGVGIMVGVHQPGQIWQVPIGGGYFAIGQLVSNNDCRRFQSRDSTRPCAVRYGAVLYLPHADRGGHGVEHTLFAIPDPHSWR